MGTLRVSGDGTATGDAILTDGRAFAGAKLVVLNFDVTDLSYVYSITGQLTASCSCGRQALAKLTRGATTIFDVRAGVDNPPSVAISKTGTLPPGNYTLSVEIDTEAFGGVGTGGHASSSGRFNFALDQAPTPTPTPTTTATPTPTPGAVTQAVNLSTRLLVGTGDNVGIGGFIITGSEPKQVLLRGIGPSLAGAGIANPLADPVLELHGPDSFVTVTNNNWRETQEAAINATGIAPHHDLESAILVTLDPGSYTAILKGNGATSGVALVEVYGVGASTSKLANISTRAFVSTGNDIVIAGFILGGGSSNPRIILRGLGPSLAASGISPVLADPTLDLRDSQGALLISNNNWQDTATEPPVFGTGLEPTHLLEAATGATLPPGAYTALLSGVDGGTGLGLVEVYDLGRQ
ncbi:MAG TPA: hypothetical protein VJU77_10885 [Chthoniobacterales bacterium]|nr:hypothetical protein [Chthoniobacterales bacterium]